MAMGSSHRVAWVCGCLLVIFCWWDWWVVVWGGLALWLREGYGGCLVFWYGGKFNSISGIVDLLWSEVGLWGIGLMDPVL